MKYKYETYKGINIHFMKIANLFGWVFNFNEKDYGSYVDMLNVGVSEEDTLLTLRIQVKESIDLLL